MPMTFPSDAEFLGGPFDGVKYHAAPGSQFPARLEIESDGKTHVYVARVTECGRVCYWHRGAISVHGVQS